MPQLQITESFAAPVEDLYTAWTRLDTIRRWFAPGAMTVSGAAADVRVGGRYRIVMQEPGGGPLHIVGGEYTEVAENACLAFTWQWEGSPAQTSVRLEFRAKGRNASQLVLTHTGFGNDDARDKHGQGWAGCLENLRKVVP